MPCLLALIALIAPRFVVAVIWFTSNWFSSVFPSALWGILGFLFLPTALLWYTAVFHWWDGVWEPWRIVVLILAIATDVSPASGRRDRG
jgi:hypothetical protein